MMPTDSQVKRPRSLTVIGWLFIVVGCAGILNDVWPLVTSNAAQRLAELRAQGFDELGPAWISRLLAVVGGAFILAGFNWARWLLVAWMLFHVALSAMHSPWEVLVHTVLFTPILYVLFRQESAQYFRTPRKA